MNDKKKFSKELSYICAFGGFISYYIFGMFVVILLAAILLALWIVEKTKPIKEDYLNAALALQIGHALGLCIGLFVDWTKVLPDLIFITFGVILLILLPGIFSTIILSIYNLVALANSILLIINEPFWSSNFKALIIHIIMRVSILILLIYGCYKLKKTIKYSNSGLNNENNLESDDETIA